MEELQPQDLEDLLQELEEEYSAEEVLAPEVQAKVRVCPECGKHNPENVWHCIDCGTMLSMKTLMDVEDGQPSMAPIVGQRARSSLSPHFDSGPSDDKAQSLSYHAGAALGSLFVRIRRSLTKRLASVGPGEPEALGPHAPRKASLVREGDQASDCPVYGAWNASGSEYCGECGSALEDADA